MEELYCVYKHTTPNGKVYIGQTKKTIQNRWKNGKGYTCHHHGWFWKAIEKYGWDNIEHEILYDDLTKKLADYYEKYFINIYRSTDKRYGYNCQTGGSRDYRYSEWSRKNISESLKKRYAINPPDTSKARAVLQKKQGRRIAQYDLMGNKLNEFNSAYDAELQTGIKHQKINATFCCPNRIKKADGYMWRYVENAPDHIEPYDNKPKILYLDDSNVVLGIYKTQKEASNATGISQSTISNILNHRFKTSKVLQNRTFRFETEVEHEDLKLKD